MKHVIGLTLVLAAAMLNAQEHHSAEQKAFISGGSIRIHLESGGYTIRPSDSNQISITYDASSESDLNRVEVEIHTGPSAADVYVRNTPNNHFNAVIEVPRRSNLWVRLTAGKLEVQAVEGDKDLEIRAGQLSVDIPHPDDYGRRDASVLTGAIQASAFNVNKGGMFRSFEQRGPGKFRLHAHILSGEIDLR